VIRLLVVLGEGGHTKQMLRLVDLLGPCYHYHYVAVEGDDLSTAHLPQPGPVYRLSRPRSKVQGRTDPPWVAAWQTLGGLWQAWRILRQVHPQAVLGNGPGISVPVSLVGKLLGARVIHVESASRVRRLSLTGRLLYRVADLFFVQWEGLREHYPRAIYAGRLW
jgi:beta-1,4-N-acetylglucosaminyltransferase